MNRLEKLRVTVWSAMVLVGMVWGVATGASLYGGVGLPPMTAIFGVLAMIVLVATQIMLHLEHPLSTSKKENK